jgi:hypothetical protein
MPRRSEADHLKVVALGGPKLEPPKALDADEARAWRAVAASLPDEWTDGGSSLILRRVASMAAWAERDEERLRQLATAEGDHLDVELALRRAHRETTRSLIGALGSLRATPGSRMRPRDAGRAFDRSPAPGDARPWELRAPAVDDDGGEAR